MRMHNQIRYCLAQLSHTSIRCPLTLMHRCCASTNSSSSDSTFDVVVIGGGIVGAATVHDLINRIPDLKCAIVEKENQFAMHQSGRSSGVIHAGIYYQPGSLMAKLCGDGLQRMYKFCEKYNVPHRKCGKLIVATEPSELDRLNLLYERSLINKVPDITMVEGKDIKQIEPYCQGLKAIHSPWTGIADYGAVTKKLVEIVTQAGSRAYTDFKVTALSLTEEANNKCVKVTAENGKCLRARYVISAAGLYSDRLAAMSGCDPLPKIVPFRGDYLVLKPEKQHMVKGNIYPVPDPRFPFLGFHFTPKTNGDIWLGPNAVLSFKREGYSPFDFNLREFSEAVTYRGLQKLVLKNFSYAVREVYYGINLRATVKKLQRFIPDITPNDVVRGPSGVRAQALAADGSLVGDFLFDSGTGPAAERILHVRNAPSPAATSSLAIAEMVVDRAIEQFQLPEISQT